MPALSAAAPPAGIESDQNVMLWGPPATFVKRTVAPAGMVIELGSNAARVLPLPVIFTSTTGPVDVAAAGAAGGALCICDWFWSLPFLPQASVPMATTVVSKAKRIAGLLRTWAGNWGRVSLVVSLVNCFTIAINIERGPQNGSPPKTQLPHAIAFRAVTPILGRHFPTPQRVEAFRATYVCDARTHSRCGDNRPGSELAVRIRTAEWLFPNQSGRDESPGSHRRLWRARLQPAGRAARRRVAVRDLALEEQDRGGDLTQRPPRQCPRHFGRRDVLQSWRPGRLRDYAQVLWSRRRGRQFRGDRRPARDATRHPRSGRVPLWFHSRFARPD